MKTPTRPRQQSARERALARSQSSALNPAGGRNHHLWLYCLTMAPLVVFVSCAVICASSQTDEGAEQSQAMNVRANNVSSTQASSSTSQPLASRQTHLLVRRIYRIRAAPTNGKFLLVPPQHQPQMKQQNTSSSSNSSGSSAPTTSKEVSDEEQLAESTQHFGARTVRPPISSSTNASEIARSSSGARLRASQMVPAASDQSTTSTGTATTSWQKQACQQQPIGAGEEQQQPQRAHTRNEQNDISASSQTLRLLPPAHQKRPTHTIGGDVGEVDDSEPPPSTSVSGGRHAPLEPNREVEEGAEPAVVPQAAADMANSQQDGGGSGGEGAEPAQVVSSVVAPVNLRVSDSILGLIDDFDSKITTNKTKAALSCDSGEMIVRLNFSEPFKGIVYPDHNRLSPCRFFGDNHHNYELRLPLRGCGTRQVAPRVFVNDVVVRFHKTLELEEDEVKTLICRYPPPLVAGAHELDSSANKQEGNSANSAGDQFELIDTLAARQPLPPLDSSAPDVAGGGSNSSGRFLQQLQFAHKTHQLNDALDGGLSNGLKTRQDAEDALKASSNSRMRNANLIVTPNSRGNTNLVPPNEQATTVTRGSSGANGSFFDRLTSVELLFLISLLMFLVLLALGLLAGYYCLSRRRRLHSHRTRLASAFAQEPHAHSARAILRKSRQLEPNSQYQTGGHRASLARAAAAAAAASAGGGRLQQARNHQHHYAASPVMYQQRQQHYYPADAYQDRQRLHLAPTSAPSSPEDESSDISGRVLLSHHRNHNHQHHRHQRAPGTDYSLSLGRPMTAPTTDERARTYYVSNLNHAFDNHEEAATVAAPVLGRREQSALYGTSGGSEHTPLVVGGRARQNRKQQVATASGPHVHYLQPGKAANRIYSNDQALAWQAQKQAPVADAGGSLLKLSSDFPVASSNQREEWPPRVQSPIMAPQRTKSLQQLDQRLPLHLDPEHDSEQWQHTARPNHSQLQHLRQYEPISRETATLNRRRRPQLIRRSQALEDLSGGGNGRAPRMKLANLVRPQQFASVTRKPGTSRLEVSSDSECAPNKITEDRRPMTRIVLKSIEDSYVTNVTEIHEQEYSKRESRQPLSWTQWRSAVQRSSERMRQTESDDEGGNRSLATNTSNDNQPDGGEGEAGANREGEEAEEDGSQSKELRSLTELDVDYAKTLSISRGSNYSRRLPPAQREASTVIAADSPSEANQQQVANGGHNTSVRGKGGGSETPDLILSPEYDLSGDRLKLTPANSPNSISYV